MTTPTPPPNLDNIQGDIVHGLPKRSQEFIFFVIINSEVANFRKNLRNVIPLITTTRQVLDDLDRIKEHKKASQGPDDLLSMEGANIAFSAFGTRKMGFAKGTIGDDDFDNGQALAAPFGLVGLGDSTITLADNTVVLDWDNTFLTQLDGVILITGDNDASCEQRRVQILSILANTIQVIDIVRGRVRPGDEKGHEHFGFNDGISQPVIAGFGTTPFKGQDTIPPGITIVGQPGDPSTPRPQYAIDGSFLVFRKLRQFVPEFNTFLLENGTFDGLTPQEGADFLGARLMGRWKSGLSIDISPLVDDPVAGNDPNRNNDFRYTFTNPDDKTDQTRCPFAAHLRKTNPRGDLDGQGGTERNRIFRQGIPYGEEVTLEEKLHSKTVQDRGLLFVSYQSVIFNGFQFIQEKWANESVFLANNSLQPGLDMIIGQKGGQSRSMVGFDPRAQQTELKSMIQFVEARGGEYFFSPSISALNEFFSTAC